MQKYILLLPVENIPMTDLLFDMTVTVTAYTIRESLAKITVIFVNEVSLFCFNIIK